MSQYISIFKIDGVPILPPLMTPKIREEMRLYKEMACGIEKKLAMKRLKESNSSDSSYNSCTEIIKDQYNLSSDIASNSSVAESSYDTQPYEENESNYLKVSSMMKNYNDNAHQKLEKSETLICDISDDKSKISTPKSSIKPDTLEYEMNSLVSNGTTVNLIYDDEEICETYRKEMSRSVPPPICEPISPLIRSNSYTLLTPSPLLVKHLKSQGVEFNQTENSNPSQIKDVTHQVTKSSESCNNKTFKAQPSPNYRTVTKKLKPKSSIQKKPNSFSGIHGKKSPYDISLSAATKPIKNIKSKTQLLYKPRLNNNNNNNLVANNPIINETYRANTAPLPSTGTHNLKEMLNEIEEQQRKQILQLIIKHKEEQKLMEENFNRQQELLLKQFKQTISSVEKMDIASAECSYSKNKSPSFKDDKNINNSFEKTASNLDLAIKPVSKCLLEQYLDIAKQPTPPKNYIDLQQQSNSRERLSQKCNRRLFQNKTITVKKNTSDKNIELAATKINAGVRGYLVRRLFKTDHVQQIIQIIQDTLIFVLDLHADSLNQSNEDPIETELKTQSLQQLTSACYALHDIFFCKSIKERLSIITKDRELLKSRIEKLKSKTLSQMNSATATVSAHGSNNNFSSVTTKIKKFH